MSGPKISEYELEQRRKEELRKREAEINRLRSSIVSSILSAESVSARAAQNLSRIAQQEGLIVSSKLKPQEKKQVLYEIQQKKRRLQSIIKTCGNIQQIVCSESLEKLRAQAASVSSLERHVSAVEAEETRSEKEYSQYMAKLTENLYAQFASQTYTLEEAIKDLRERKAKEVSPKSKTLEAARAGAIDDAKSLLNESAVSEENKSRICDAIQVIMRAEDEAEIHSVQSLVIKEIRYQTEEARVLLPKYQSLLASKISLLDRLGVKSESATQQFTKASDYRAAIHSLEQEVAQLELRMAEKAEHDEIARGIDEAMQELGYHLLGKKPGVSSGSEDCLYAISEDADVAHKSVRTNTHLYALGKDTGVKIYRQQDGTVRMRIVGLNGGQWNDGEKLDLQNSFCEVYDHLVDLLSQKGIVMRAGTDRRSPPSVGHWRVEDRETYIGVGKSKPKSHGTSQAGQVDEQNTSNMGADSLGDESPANEDLIAMRLD